MLAVPRPRPQRPSSRRRFDANGRQSLFPPQTSFAGSTLASTSTKEVPSHTPHSKCRLMAHHITWTAALPTILERSARPRLQDCLCSVVSTQEHPLPPRSCHTMATGLMKLTYSSRGTGSTIVKESTHKWEILEDDMALRLHDHQVMQQRLHLYVL